MPKPIYTHCPACGGTGFTAAVYYHDCELRGSQKPAPSPPPEIPEGPLFCRTCGEFRYEAVLYCHGCHHLELKKLKPPKVEPST